MWTLNLLKSREKYRSKIGRKETCAKTGIEFTITRIWMDPRNQKNILGNHKRGVFRDQRRYLCYEDRWPARGHQLRTRSRII